MKEVKIILFSIITAAALSVPVSYASMQQSSNGLNLTNEQKKLLEENRNKQRGQKKLLFEQMGEKTALIRQELQKDELNMDKIHQINTELKNLQAQILDERLEGILEVRKILTPEQFKKFIAKTQARPGHFKNKLERAKGSF